MATLLAPTKISFTTTSLLFRVLLFLLGSFRIANGALSNEGQILLQMKQALTDAPGSLKNWDPSSDSPCHSNWTGVQCNNGVIVGLDFTFFNLSGSVPTIMCQLPNLVRVNFYYNDFGGPFPAKLLSCVNLTHLNLSQNLIVGSLPSKIDRIKRLKALDLSANNFCGPIPQEFGLLPDLLQLYLNNNNLNGTIPLFLGQLGKLQDLRLAYNPFSPGPIPPELGRLTELTYLWLTNCTLEGTIPDIFANLSKLTNLDFAINNLTGSIPSSMMNLRYLYQLELYQNRLSGPIPENLGNLGHVINIDMSHNHLTGPIPESISRLKSLSSLHLTSNSLSGQIPDGLAELPRLQYLPMSNNKFTGSLPINLGSSSPLNFIDLSYNDLSGQLPANICAGGSLQFLDIMQNHLSGEIPKSYVKCTKVIRLRLSNNELSGTVPEGLWGLTALYILDLAFNKLEGAISPLIAKATDLSIMYLQSNNFSGSLPPEMGYLNLSEITAQSNLFSGRIPGEFGMLISLTTLQLQHNSLSGEIPNEICACVRLATLDLSDNHLTGPIPPSLGKLRNLNTLDLSKNMLTGRIPPSLTKLNLIKFNVSENSLLGPIPGGLIQATFYTSFMENQGLCGEKLRDVKICTSQFDPKPLKAILTATSVAALLVLLSCLGWFFTRLRQDCYTNEARIKSDKAAWSMKSFQKLGFNEYEILSSLSEDKVIGEGSAGKVYKITLNNDKTVAVKEVLRNANGWGRQDNGFETEVETLGNIRHKNIVKLLCCCSNRESNVLVFEYMSNGSLGSILHGTKASILDWNRRYIIAVGAAQGLAYLHHGCKPPIVHRDIKSSNILLDSDFEAYVSDFGLAKILETKKSDSSIVAGTPGYIAPEHGYTFKVTEKSDVYSFGVVLLELVTGKKPTNVLEFGEHCDIVNWVLGKVKDLEGVIDSRLGGSRKEDIVLVLEVALLCTSVQPEQRPSMMQVVELLLAADPEHKLGAGNNKSKGAFSKSFISMDPSLIDVSFEVL